MNVKVGVVVLVGIVVAFALVLFYGGVRPGGSSESGRGGVENLLGGLRGSRAVTFDDVASASCADAASGELRVPAGGSCAVALPASGELRLCALEGGSALVGVVKGRDYPAQRVGPGDVICTSPSTLRVYDEDSTLTVTCGLNACRLRLDGGS